MKRLVVFFFFILLWIVPALAQNASVPNAAEIRLALEKLNVLGAALYIAAHPDDENTGLIAYWAGEKKYRAAYLSLTRGDGGQNLIGAEKGSDIGILRSQELMAARRIDGGEQFFSRAIDFGYSKSMEETLRIWGHDAVLADTVWVIRRFRPDVIVTRFPLAADGGGGHGHHTASAELALEAFTAAADPHRFPEQLQYVQPWQAKRILLNYFRFGGAGGGGGASATAPVVDIGAYNPGLGLSYNEIAGRSRSMHKSQGFGSLPVSGSQLESFRLLKGEPARQDIMEGVDTSWRRVAGGAAIERDIQAILDAYDMRHPAASLPALLALDEKLARLDGPDADPWLAVKRQELRRLIQACAGLRLEAFAEDYAATPGESVNITINLIQRDGQPVRLAALNFPTLGQRFAINQEVADNSAQTIRRTVTLGADYPLAQPYWLRKPEGKGLFVVPEQLERGLPENPPTLPLEAEMTILGKHVVCTVPVSYRWLERAEGEKRRPFEVRPPVTANFTGKVAVFHPDRAREITLTLRNQAAQSRGTARLEVPPGWQATPAAIPFEFSRRHDEKVVTFTLRPPTAAARDGVAGGAAPPVEDYPAIVRDMERMHPGTATLSATLAPPLARAVVTIDGNTGGAATKTRGAATAAAHPDKFGKNYSYSLTEIIYPHIASQLHLTPAELKLITLPREIARRRIGYIAGSGDDIAAILRDMGHDVVELDDAMLTPETLAQLDVVVAGIRAYNTRERLRFAQPMLMDFVKNGGTYIVQYNVDSGLQTTQIGPYPFRISRLRIVEEDAPLRFLAPRNPLMLYPNRITEADFADWVQERGLYFPEQWDAAYTPLFAGHDSGESDLAGSTLYTRYGRGVFIYSSLAFFRQLPAGVPGAFRLWQNMIAAGEHATKATE